MSLKKIFKISTALCLVVAGCDAQKNNTKYWYWKSIAFNTEISVKIHDHVNPEEKKIIRNALSKRTHQIEKIFSLYYSGSELNRLNKEKHLTPPSREFHSVSKKGIELGEMTQGVFDLSIQSLWKWHDKGKQKALPASILRAVNFTKIKVSEKQILLTEEKMELSYNGFIQGYLTDELASVLRKHSIENALINGGEYKALGYQDGRSKEWQVNVKAPHSITPYDLAPNMSLAVSAGYAYPFENGGEKHHLIHPHLGRSVNQERETILVFAGSALLADALATAIAISSAQQRKDLSSIVAKVIVIP